MTVKVLEGCARARLLDLEPSSIDCVVTSPPYWGLRDYQLGPDVWGGDPDCDHEFIYPMRGAWANGLPGPNGASLNTRRRNRQDHVFSTKEAGKFCRCEAWLGELGLEPTVELYVEHVVEVMRGVRRVLKTRGTVWLNVGDCHVSAPPGNKGKRSAADKDGAFHRRGQRQLGHGEDARTLYARGTSSRRPASGLHKNVKGIPLDQPNRRPQTDLKPKDLVMVPFRVGLALQADGWWVRQVVIWEKPNVLPENVKDRPSTSHEYVFLLTRSERYDYDWKAIAEEVTGNSHDRGKGIHPKSSQYGLGIESFGKAITKIVDRRNKRSVWQVPTEPYAEAHFSTFPTELVRPCIRAGCPEGGIVLDPFAGSGTTGLVADQEHRDAILIDPSPVSVQLARGRIYGPLFAELVEEA
jgi:DNA modification methylase